MALPAWLYSAQRSSLLATACLLIEHETRAGPVHVLARHHLISCRALVGHRAHMLLVSSFWMRLTALSR